MAGWPSLHELEPQGISSENQPKHSIGPSNKNTAWKIRETDSTVVTDLLKDRKITPLLARLLALRNVVDVDKFFEAKLSSLRAPEGLTGLEDALELIEDAIVSKKTIGVFGDYDADGITTATLLTLYLRQSGATVVPRVADRHEGYGLVSKAIHEFYEKECQLLISGDCGTSDIDSLKLAKSFGISTVVIDHHTVPEGDLAAHPADVLINPFRSDSTFPFKGLASVGLAFYVVAALRTRLRGLGYFKHRPEPSLIDLLDLVAIGSVADLVPLIEENRILVREGLKILAQKKRLGLQALLKMAGVTKSTPVDEETIGWKIGPRLNAPGRMGSAKPALDLLLADTSEEAISRSTLIEQINLDRRKAQNHVFEEALVMAEAKKNNTALVIAGTGWESGVVGIVAARLAEKYKKTTVVIAVDNNGEEARGSGRRFGNVNLYDALLSCSSHLIRFGGHAAAAGLTLDPIFLESFEQAFQNTISAMQKSSETDFISWADAEIGLEELDKSRVLMLKKMGPFGKGNEEPVFLARNLEVAEARAVGDGSHLKMSFVDKDKRSVSGIGFGLVDRYHGEEIVDVLFKPKIGNFRGIKSLELHIQDIRSSEVS